MHQRTNPQPTAPSYQARRLDYDAARAARAANAAAGLAARHQLDGDAVAAVGARALARWHRGRMLAAADRARRLRFAATINACAGDDLEVPA